MAKRTEKKIPPIIQSIQITQARRTSQDITSWRNAIKTAENVYMPRRALLYDLYEEILLDGHLSATIEKRKLAVSNTPIVFMENGKENEKLTSLTETEDFINLIHYIIESKLWGHSLIEMDFRNGGLIPTLIPRKHVEPTKGIILKTQFENSGFSYREAPYSNFCLEIGYSDTLGILMKAAQYVIYKRGGFGDWAQYAELFGMPFRIAKYDGFDEKTRGELETALKEAGSAAYVVIPKEADFEFIQNATNGSSTLYETLINVCNKELSKLILGQTLTTEAGGSMAQAKVHQEVELEIHFADKLFVKNVLNDKLLPLLKIHGYKTGTGKFLFNQQENIDLKTRLDMDLKLAEKIKIDDNYFYETYNIPYPNQPIA
jgi:phage gp29-like protein